jgi:uncharacterized protein involved in response to NO
MPTERSISPLWPAVLGYGFRSLFLFAGMHAVMAIPVWLLLLQGFGSFTSPLPPLAWHAHEMLLGVILAAVAGFILTTVPGWTALMDALIDIAFIPIHVLTILPALIRSDNQCNLIFIVMLAALFSANLHFHLDGATEIEPLLLGINVILLMVTMAGGRTLPAFTASGLKQHGIDIRIRRYPPLDIAA